MNELSENWSVSQLTADRPDIWARALELARGTTGILYVEKRPLPDGTIFSCGHGNYPSQPSIRERIEKKQNQIDRMRKNPYDHSQREIDQAKDELAELLELSDTPKSQAVYLPSGAMEWLLHEVGHWLAASDADRRSPNYGDGGEIEAWAFEEAVLSNLGPAREFTPPTQRDGTAFTAGPIPGWAFRRIDKRLADGGITVEPFQSLWAEWVAWGRTQGPDAPWLQVKM